MHDGLQDGGEGSDSDAGGDEDRMLSAKNVARWSSERTVDVDLGQQEANGYWRGRTASIEGSRL